MRLTPEVLRSAPVYLNPTKEREIGLRGKCLYWPLIPMFSIMSPHVLRCSVSKDPHIVTIYPI